MRRRIMTPIGLAAVVADWDIQPCAASSRTFAVCLRALQNQISSVVPRLVADFGGRLAAFAGVHFGFPFALWYYHSIPW